MRLLDLSHFEVVFGRYTSATRLGLVDGDGNTGDRLLYAATRRMLREFWLTWRTVNILAGDDVQGLDELLLFAGGSMGGWRPAQLIRQRAVATGLPCTVLPQSWLAPEPLPFKRAYARETASLQFAPGAILAPDLALGFDFPEIQRATRGPQLLLRRTDPSAFNVHNYPASIDPAELTYSADDYLDFIADYDPIITDRLHVAIVGLGLRRRVTILPSHYHKNRSMWETWLSRLGCLWADTPEEALIGVNR
jgi:Exopolysaccharide biosynthesis protein